MRNKIINIAKKEIGYKEQGKNITKYGEWYGMQDEWCNIFVCWCANQAGIGEDIIPKMAYVPSTANWFDAKGLYKNSQAHGGSYIPQIGDIVLFDYNGNTTSDHIGLVEKVEGQTLYTIEGNKDNQVKRCTYTLSDRGIRAYCVPEYIIETVPVVPVAPVVDPKKEVIRSLQHAYNVSYGTNLEEDGIKGVKTEAVMKKYPIRNYTANEVVRWVQDRLVNHKGYGLVIDGKYGSQTEAVVRQFQRDNNKLVDGIAGYETISILI